MSIDITKLTDQDIRKFKREIEGYERNKRLFLILGFCLPRHHSIFDVHRHIVFRLRRYCCE